MTGKLFILAEPRSGSSWLLNTLNSYQDIDLRGELYNHAVFPGVLEFHKAKKEDFQYCIDYLENKFAAPAPGPSKRKNKRYYGCKILLNQLAFISPDFPVYFIEKYSDSYFIFLCRENIVEANISLRIAHKYNNWHAYKREDVIKRTVHINPWDFYAGLEKTRQQRDHFVKLLTDFAVNHICLTYEKFFAHKEKVLEDIGDFLHLTNPSFRFSDEKKGNRFRPDEIIENYEEVKHFLEQYPYYHEMLLPRGEEVS